MVAFFHCKRYDDKREASFLDIEMQYVYAVYRENSFSQAAEKLFISQSAVSAMVRKAEKELGCQIFDRSTIPFTLTEEGRFYIESIKKIWRIEQDMRSYFNDRKNLKVGHLRVGSSSFYSAHFLMRIVQAFRKKYPGIQVDIAEGDGKELKGFLLDGSIDFLFGALSPEELESHSVFYTYEHLALAVPEQFEVNKRLARYQLSGKEIHNLTFLDENVPSVPLSELRDCPFVTLTKSGSDLYQRTIDLCRNVGFTPKVVQCYSQTITAFYAAAAGEGVTFIRSSIFSLVNEPKGLVYYKVDDPLTKRPLHIFYSKNRYVSHAMSAFLEFTLSLPRRYRM